MDARGSYILKDEVHKESTGMDCANFFDIGANGLNLLAACATPRVLIYKIDLEKNG